MDHSQLRNFLNHSVRLSFKDGEAVEAVLLGMDAERDRDLTYEVRKIVARGPAAAKGTVVGTTYIASIDDLAAWEPVSV